jgi:hypothetical protein
MGLAQRLASTLRSCHTSEAVNEIAACVRLVDIVVHARGERVDRKLMLRLAHARGLHPKNA